MWVEYEMGLFFSTFAVFLGEFFFQWRWRSPPPQKKKTPILISRLNKAKALKSFAFVFPSISFSLVGDFWVGKFVKVHGKRSEKPVGLLLGEVKSKPKEKVAESDAPKEELSRFTGGWKGSKNDKPRNVLFGWLVGWSQKVYLKLHATHSGHSTLSGNINKV